MMSYLADDVGAEPLSTNAAFFFIAVSLFSNVCDPQPLSSRRLRGFVCFKRVTAEIGLKF